MGDAVRLPMGDAMRLQVEGVAEVPAAAEVPPTGGAVRPRASLSVPLLGLASDGDVSNAEQLLLVHVPREVTRAFCLACRTTWPCPEVRYARAITAGQAVWGDVLA